MSSGQRVSERAPDIALGLELASSLSAVVADAPAYPTARLVEALQEAGDLPVRLEVWEIG